MSEKEDVPSVRTTEFTRTVTWPEAFQTLAAWLGVVGVAWAIAWMLH